MSDNYGLQLNTKRYKFIQDALDGSNGFANGGYIVKFPRESSVKYDSRKELAWYINYLKPACNKFIGYLSKKPPTRKVSYPLIESFLEDCDWKENSLSIFLADFFVEAKAKGIGFVLVEMPIVQPESLEQQLTNRFFPYLVAIKPEDVNSYSLNNKGLLDYLTINSYLVIDNKTEPVIRGWDDVKWWVEHKGKVIQQGEHNLGVCPVLPFSEAYNFPSVGVFAQIADISKRLFNLHSELDELLRGQTFSILTYQIPADQQSLLDPKALSEAVGTDNMLIYAGTSAPSFIAAPSAPAETILKTIAALEQKVKDISMDIDFSGSTAESGTALTIRFQALNAALSSFARKGEDFERRLFDLVSRWLAIENTTTVSYEKTYEISDITTEMNNLATYQSAGFPVEVIDAKKKQIINLDFSNLERTELAILIDSVDNAEKEVGVLESRVAMLEAANNSVGNDTMDNTEPSTGTDLNGGVL